MYMLQTPNITEKNPPQIKQLIRLSSQIPHGHYFSLISISQMKLKKDKTLCKKGFTVSVL